MKAGAEVDKQGYLAMTALVRAATNGHTEIIRLLVNARATVAESLKDNPIIIEAIAAIQGSVK